MFGFFNAEKNKWRPRVEEAFDNYLPTLQTMPAEEIALIIDMAVAIRDSSTYLYEEDDPYVLAFYEPDKVEQKKAFEFMNHWIQAQLEWAQTPDGMFKNAALNIWFLTLASFAIPELNFRGKQLWAELQRGFEFCEYQNPGQLMPKDFA
jgi:hypothetical protein